MSILRVLIVSFKDMNFLSYCYRVPPRLHPSPFIGRKPLVLVAFMICNMTTYLLTFFNGVAQIYHVPCMCTALLAVVARVVGSLSFCLTVFDAGASRPAAPAAFLCRHGLVFTPLLPLLRRSQLRFC
jgi:hypothetical protein